MLAYTSFRATHSSVNCVLLLLAALAHVFVCSSPVVFADDVLNNEVLIHRDYKTVAPLVDKTVALLGGKGSVVVYDIDTDSFSSEKTVDSTRFLSHASYAGLDYFVSNEHELWFRDPTTRTYSNVGGVDDRKLRCVAHVGGKLVCSTLEGDLYQWNGSSFELVFEKAPKFIRMYSVYDAVIGVDLYGNVYRASFELSEFEQMHLPSFPGSRSVQGLKVRDSLLLMWTATHVVYSRDAGESFEVYPGTGGRWNIDIANDSIVVGMNLNGEYITTNLNTKASERTTYSDIPISLLGFPEDGINLGDRILLCGFGSYIAFVNTESLIPELRSTFLIRHELYDGPTFIDYLPDGTICAGYLANTLNYTQDGVQWRNIVADTSVLDAHILDHIQGVTRLEDGTWFAKSNNKVLWSQDGLKWTKVRDAGSKPVYLGKFDSEDKYAFVSATATGGTSISFYDTLTQRTNYHFQTGLFPNQCIKPEGDSLLVFGYYGAYNSDTMVATSWVYDTAANVVDKTFYSFFTSIKKIVQVESDVFAIAQSGRSNYDNVRHAIVKLDRNLDVKDYLLLPEEYNPISLHVVDDVLVSFSSDKKIYMLGKELEGWTTRDVDSTNYVDFSRTSRNYVRFDEDYRLLAGELDSASTVVSVSTHDILALNSILGNVYPNPGTGKFAIVLRPGVSEHVRLVQIVNNEGEVVLDLSDQLEILKPGTEQTLEWEMPRTCTSGTYFVTIQHGGMTSSAKFIVER